MTSPVSQVIFAVLAVFWGLLGFRIGGGIWGPKRLPQIATGLVLAGLGYLTMFSGNLLEPTSLPMLGVAVLLSITGVFLGRRFLRWSD